MTVVEHVEGFQIEIKNLFQLNAILEVCAVMSRYIKRMCGCDLTVGGVSGNRSSGYNDCARSIE